MRNVSVSGFVEAGTRVEVSSFTPDLLAGEREQPSATPPPVWTFELGTRGAAKGNVVLYFRDVADLKRVRDAINEGLHREGLEP